MGIRVAVIDDNPHVRWHGQVYPVNATFHRFLSAFLDLEGSPVASIAHVVPLRELPDDASQPQTLPLDPRLEVVGTAPFNGIAGYLRWLPLITASNIRPLRRAIRDADLVWLKVPASNALLAAGLARRAGVPRFVYVAGRASDVVAGQRRGIASGLAARAAAAGYDSVGRLVARGAARVVVGEGLVDGGGIVTSLVEAAELRAPTGAWPRDPGRLRLAWAGRLAAGKGLETLLEAMTHLEPSVTLDLLGDGPARGELEARSAAMGLRERVAFAGYVAERAPYLDRLAAADLFVFPSPAEGFPKVVLDAMAAGLPVVATRAGALARLADRGLIAPVPASDPVALAAAVRLLAEAGARTGQIRARGTAFAALHTRDAEAALLVDMWRGRFPTLPWE